MKLLHITFFLLLFTTSMNAQTNQHEDDYVLPFDSLTTKDKIHYNFAIGAGVNFSDQIGTSFTTFYQPSITYDLSPKFKINTGLLYMNSSVSNVGIYSDNQYQLFSGSISEYYAYIKGQYQVNERLLVGGGIYYNNAQLNAFDGLSLNKDYNQRNNIGYSANFKYYIAKGLTLEGEIRVNDPAVYNPFGRNQAGNFNSFFSDEFGYPFRTW